MMKQQGILKYLSKLSYTGEVRTKFRAANLENGKKIHQQNLDRNDKINAQYLESVLEGLKETWTNQGFNAKEINTIDGINALEIIVERLNNY